jgi:gamma-glutamylcyclotransferase (GGCT)/AIG2-like uncharacterized protein YtfP
LAVYGTLRPKAAAEPRHLLEEGLLVNEGAMVINGWAMYSLGGYPGIKPVPGDSITVNILRRGEECSDEQWQSIIDGFDRYEGYREGHESNSLYIRRTVPTCNGSAYMYEYNYEIEGRERIESGDWLSYRHS